MPNHSNTGKHSFLTDMAAWKGLVDTSRAEAFLGRCGKAYHIFPRPQPKEVPDSSLRGPHNPDMSLVYPKGP